MWIIGVSRDSLNDFSSKGLSYLLLPSIYLAVTLVSNSHVSILTHIDTAEGLVVKILSCIALRPATSTEFVKVADRYKVSKLLDCHLG